MLDSRSADPQGASAMSRDFDLSVYLITDRDLCGARGLVDTVREAVAGGATVVQLHDAASATRDLVDEAREIAAFSRPAGVTFLLRDRVDVALAAGADGVHLGRGDMRPADARALIGPDRILGVSIAGEDDLAPENLAGVDYLGVGPTYPSFTNPDPAAPMAIGGLEAIAARARLPMVAIGGLHAGNAADAIAAGADGVAVVSAICGTADPEAAARELREVVAAAKAAREK
jgi:thiamine-phosphate pyrophosphorylase